MSFGLGDSYLIDVNTNVFSKHHRLFLYGSWIRITDLEDFQFSLKLFTEHLLLFEVSSRDKVELVTHWRDYNLTGGKTFFIPT